MTSLAPSRDGAASAESPALPALSWRKLSLLGLFLSGVIVVGLLFALDLNEVEQALRSARPVHLVWATLSYCLLFPLRGLRWRLLLRPISPKISVKWATQSFLIGFMANNILPARLGDIVRAFVLSTRGQVSRSAALTSVMLEKVFDGLTVVGFLVGVLFIPRNITQISYSSHLYGITIFMGLVFGTALIFAGLIAMTEHKALSILRRLVSPLPAKIRTKFIELSSQLASGFRILREPSLTFIVLTLTMAIWLGEVGVYVGVARSLDIDVTFFGLTLVMAILTLGLTAPSAPGFIGVFEALVIPALGLLGVVSSKAAAFAVLLHLIHYVPGTLLGFFAAYSGHVQWSDLQSKEPLTTSPETA